MSLVVGQGSRHPTHMRRVSQQQIARARVTNAVFFTLSAGNDIPTNSIDRVFATKRRLENATRLFPRLTYVRLLIVEPDILKKL